MHRVLLIPEILLNIFAHLLGFNKEARKSADCDLAALARTCRAFKGPALDILWSELNDPSALSQCLPEISCKKTVSSSNTGRSLIARKSSRYAYSDTYSFSRPLERHEWDILCSYARRIRCIHVKMNSLDWKSVTATSHFTPADPLFPNLLSLHCDFAKGTLPLLQLALPSLIRLHIQLPLTMDLLMLQKPLSSLAKTSPNIKRLTILGAPSKLASIEVISNGICGWSNLQSVTCPQIPLHVATLVHMSSLRSLARLTFMLSNTFLDSTARYDPLSFPTLDYFELHAESLDPILELLFWIQLPVVTNFTVIVKDCPSKQDLASLMLNTSSGMCSTIREFNLNQVLDDPYTAESRDPGVPVLDFDDLRHCIAFPHLRRMNIDLEWDVGLSDDELLTLASAWPRLEELLVNTNWGWNRPGITPNGLAQLLEACPSLTSIAFAVDTRDCIQMLAREFRLPVNPSSFDSPFRINVLDSIIRRGSVDAMAAFFAHIVPHFDLTLVAWEVWPVLDHSDLDEFRQYWGDVHNQASERIKKRWLNVLRGLFFP